MTPLEFLYEEFENVKRALGDTLRHDYGPERSLEYFTECESRLNEIERALARTRPADAQTICDQLSEISSLAAWISLIERSHLGEFSWPFADELRRMAVALLAETDLAGNRLEPLIHVISGDQGYRIVYELIPKASSERRFVVVAFPRSLKHHVLLHTIFGHELGHTALDGAPGGLLRTDVIGSFKASGPMASLNATNAWLHDPSAPPEVRNILSGVATPVAISDGSREAWLVELACDLFGFVLFGPAFLAAHRTLLESMLPDPYELDLPDPTHPPYAIRHTMLAQAMRLVGWDSAITDPSDLEVHQAEVELIRYATGKTFAPWAQVFDDAQLGMAIAGVRNVISAHPGLGYSPVDSGILAALVRRLVKQLPPIYANLDADGKPRLTNVAISQTLYAGWIYWVG